MTKIIAEIGWNHLGNMKIAKKMILSAKKNGADMVKIQTFSEKNLIPGPWDKDGRRELYKKASLNLKQHKILNNFSKKNKITFFSSVVNINSAELLSKVQNKIVKIPSAEIRNLELIKYCSKKFKKILISTGTSKIDEVKKVLRIVPKSKLVLLHCVSIYPLDSKRANLPKINRLKKLSKNIGYSDHCHGIITAINSLKYKPTFIEKHFTISHKLPGRDNKFSILPDELNFLSKIIKGEKDSDKYYGENFQKGELDVRKNYSGRWKKI